MIRLVQLLASWPGGAMLVLGVALVILLAELWLLRGQLRRFLRPGIAAELVAKAEKCASITGYSAALYSQLAIMFGINMTVMICMLALRETGGALSVEAVTVALALGGTALVLALATLFFAVALNLHFLRRDE